MSFLRSIIADARPRRGTRTPLEGLPAPAGRMDRPSEGHPLQTQQTSPDRATRTHSLNQSLPAQIDNAGADMDNTPAPHRDNPSHGDSQARQRHTESDVPVSISMEAFEPGLHTDSPADIDTAEYGERPQTSSRHRTSEAERQPPPRPTETINPDDRTIVTEDLNDHASTPPPATPNAQPRVLGHEETAPADSPEDSTESPQTEDTGRARTEELISRPTQSDATHQADIAEAIRAGEPPHSGDPIERTHSPKPQSDGRQTAALVPSKGSHDIGSMGEASGRRAGQNETGETPANGGEANQDHGRQPPGQPSPSPVEKPNASPRGRGDVEPVPMRTVAVPLQGSSNTASPTVVQTKGKAGERSPRSSDPGVSRPDNPVQDAAKTEKPSSSQETLRSAQVRSSHAGLVSRDRDWGQSRPPSRPPGKPPEVPKVQIGQIDVIIEAPPQSTSKPVPARSIVDLASRHYLRRL